MHKTSLPVQINCDGFICVRHYCDLYLLLGDMCKFESSQKDESRTKPADSSETCCKTRVCLVIGIHSVFKGVLTDRNGLSKYSRNLASRLPQEYTKTLLCDNLCI